MQDLQNVMLLRCSQGEGKLIVNVISCFIQFVVLNNRKYTAKVGQDNVNIGVVTIFWLANTSLLQVSMCWPAEIL